MSNGLKGLTLAAGVIITCIVISIAFFVTREAKDIAAQGIGQMGEYTTEMANGGIEFYNGLILSGNEVIRTAKRLVGKTKILIKTSGNTTGKEIQAGDKAWLTKEIYPYSNFLGEVKYNDDGSVDKLIFVQQVQ